MVIRFDDYLEQSLKKLQLRSEKVRQIAEYIVGNNKSNEYEIAKIMEKEFYEAIGQTKLAIFSVVSQVFLITNQKRDRTFFKTLSQKAKSFLQNLAVTADDDLKVMITITRIVEKWGEEEMFAPNFMEKLKKVVYQLQYKIEEIEKSKVDKFKKYKKTFLLEIYDIRDFQPTKTFYEHYIGYSELRDKMTTFNQEYEKLDLESPTPDTLERAQELAKVAEDCKERLVQIVCNLHIDFYNFRQACRIEFQKFYQEQ